MAMEILEIKNVSFSYPPQEDGCEIQALQDVNLTIREGEFVVLCGLSGSGKSTLLRLLKKQIAPAGKRMGSIYVDGQPAEAVPAATIGYVGQDPDSQIVTDRVWSELAFGLEQMAVDPVDMRRRIGEMAACFGLEKLFHRETENVSGGEKQLINLASVLVMGPKLLLLDEPTAQLDPIAATRFLQMVHQINEEWGTTVLLVEHRLEECMPMADRLVVLEQGRVLANGTPDAFYETMKKEGLAAAFPAAMQVAAALGEKERLPLTIKEGRQWLAAQDAYHQSELSEEEKPSVGEKVLTARDVWYSYEREGRPLLRGVDLALHEKEILCVVGGNGSGKSTLLSLLQGLRKPMRGRVERMKNKTSVCLPQNPDALFTADTIGEEYSRFLAKHETSLAGEDRLREVLDRLPLEPFLSRNPYDLSGGELQVCALGKLLLAKPDILLLDEPTKGMDVTLKAMVIQELKRLAEEGCALVVVTHDVQVAAQLQGTMSLCFDGQLTAPEPPRIFFGANQFYTPPAHRLGRPYYSAITVPELLVQIQRGKAGHHAET